MRNARGFPYPAVLAAMCLGATILLAHPGVVVGQTAFAPSAKPPSRAGGLSGTIAIHGCSVDAQDVMVRARPIDVESSPGRTASPGSARTVMTRVTANGPAGATSARFAFELGGLASGVPYRVGVKIVGNSRQRCPRLAWNVDRDPLVTGGDEPLAFDGYAVVSELEILGAAEGRARATWVGADAVDFADPAGATRQLRWRTTLPGATGGELQVSLARFPRVGSRAGPCAIDDTAVIKRVSFAAIPGEWALLEPVDFNRLVYGRRSDDGRRDAGAASDGLLDPDLGILDPATLTRLELGKPLYLRVVPTNADGPICDPDAAGVPTEVRVAKVLASLPQIVPTPSPRLQVEKVYYTMPVIGSRPKAGETCYRATQKHVIPSQSVIFGWSSWELLATSVVQTQGGTYPYYVPEGAQFCACNNCGDDDGWLESFADTFGAVITGLVDAVAKLVNSASELWEDIQDAAVGAVADGITALPLGIDCDSTCRKALETGLEVALATMGVPPSLPNFDQLVDQGFDYIAAQAMSEVGVPPAIADYANDQLSDAGQKFMKKAVASMKATPFSIEKLPPWLVPDLRFQRAILAVELWGPGVDQPFASRPGMILKNDPIYGGTFLHLPRKIPAKASGKPLSVPIVLEPNLAGLPGAPAGYDEYNVARVDKKYWTEQRYKNGCYHLVLTGLASNPPDVISLFSATFRADVQPIVGCGP